MDAINSVVGLGRFAVWLGALFAFVMFCLVVWYYFHAKKLDAEAKSPAADSHDAGAGA